MTNAEVAKILSEMAALLDMEGAAFKPRAFEKAAVAVGTLDQDLSDMYRAGGVKALEEIPDIGRGIAERIEEFVKTGRIKDYEALKRRTPVDITGLRRVPGLGPKTILLLWKTLKIRTLDDLRAAAAAGKIRTIPRLGKKTEENILQGLSFVSSSGTRFAIGAVWELVKKIESRLAGLSGVEQAVAAGSFRRMKDTLGDADVLAVSSAPGPVMDYFVSMPEVKRVYAHGQTKSMVQLSNGLDVDLRVVPGESFGAALNYFTGSKDHNVALRELALKRGWKLNEYGLFKGRRMIAGRSEAELYRALGLAYIEPELRENRGEIEAARSGSLPRRLVGYGDLKGDLQVQTSWTDGSNSIGEMARAARAAGLEYIAITDHTRTLAMTGGADEQKLARQGAEIDRLNAKSGSAKFKILKSAEVNILKDGSLDIADPALARLDVVGAAVHSHFGMPKAEMTRRIIRAMEHPEVDIIFHPTGRLINRRAPYQVDMDALIAAATRTGTALEIDASPDRLDLRDEYIRAGVKAGVKLVIDSDAHSTRGFEFLKFGIGQARRGWAERRNILNTLPVREFLRALAR